MLSINKPGNTACLLHLCDHVQGNRRLTTGFRSIDLNDPSLGNPTKAKGNIKAQGSCRDRFYIHLCCRISQLHDSSLTELLLNLSKGSVQCLQLFVLFHKISSPSRRNICSYSRVYQTFVPVNPNFVFFSYILILSYYESQKTPSMASLPSFLIALDVWQKMPDMQSRYLMADPCDPGSDYCFILP